MEKGAGNENAVDQVDDDDYLFDDDIQPGLKAKMKVPRRRRLGWNSEASINNQGKALLLILTYPELHQFVLEMVHLLERVYNIRHRHRYH